MTEAELMPVADIVVAERVRKDMRHVPALAESIRRVGLLHPLVINGRNELVAGSRRLEAVKRLKWSDVPVRRIVTLDDAVSALTAERDENTCRESLTPSEMGELGRKLEALERPKAKERQEELGRSHGTPSTKFVEGGSKGRTNEKVAAAVGTSRETLRKINEIREAAQADPDHYGDLVEAMDGNGKVDPAHKELKKRQAKARAKGDTLKDALGVEVPSGLRDLFGDPWLVQTATALEEIHRDVLRSIRKRVDGKGPRFKFLHVAEVLKALDRARTDLEIAASQLAEARPYAVCPGCAGKGCKLLCRDAGWLPKWRHTELKKERAI
jgi:hypothetical protein